MDLLLDFDLDLLSIAVDFLDLDSFDLDFLLLARDSLVSDVPGFKVFRPPFDSRLVEPPLLLLADKESSSLSPDFLHSQCI